MYKTDLNLFARRVVAGTSFLSDVTDISELDIPDSPSEIMPPPEQSHISFLRICEQIKSYQSDILLIIDSSFAASAFSDLPFRGRKCELLCSIDQGSWSRAPGTLGSFTGVLIKSLVELIKEKSEGFSTTDLYRRIYRQQHQAHKPFLFNQSRLDFGQIWLRPFTSKVESVPEAEPDAGYTIDVRFHLTKGLTTMDLNKLVKALQWLPFVKAVEMQNMSSPADDLDEFIRTVHLANSLRPLLAQTRQRREEAGTSQVPESSNNPAQHRNGEPSHAQQPGHQSRVIELFDFSSAKAVTSRGDRLSPGEYLRSKEA
jgi:hypothetical protein